MCVFLIIYDQIKTKPLNTIITILSFTFGPGVLVSMCYCFQIIKYLYTPIKCDFDNIIVKIVNITAYSVSRSLPICIS